MSLPGYKETQKEPYRLASQGESGGVPHPRRYSSSSPARQLDLHAKSTGNSSGLANTVQPRVSQPKTTHGCSRRHGGKHGHRARVFPSLFELLRCQCVSLFNTWGKVGSAWLKLLHVGYADSSRCTVDGRTPTPPKNWKDDFQMVSHGFKVVRNGLRPATVSAPTKHALTC